MKIKYPFKVALLIFVLQTMFAFSQTVAPMQITCVAVDAAGNISLNFTSVTGVPNFNNYQIFYSNDKFGTYTPYVDPVNGTNQGVTSTSSPIIIAAPNANSQPYYFYTVINYTLNSNPEVSISDTVSSIFVQYSSANDGYSNLSWNAVRTPLLTTSNAYYYVNRGFKEYNSPLYPFLALLLSDSTSALNIADNVIGKCDDDITYQIAIKDFANGGCISKSNIITQSFTTPGAEPPVISSVNYFPTFNKSQVVYAPSVSNFAKGYIAYKLTCTGPAIADTILGYNTTIYNDFDTVKACNDCIDFRMASYFSCQTLLPVPNNGNYYKIGQPSSFNNVIKVNNTFDKCTYEATLTWCPFKNWAHSLKNYNVWVGVNGQPAAVIATLDTTASSYVFKVGKDSAEYVFQIEAVSNDGISSFSFYDTLIANVNKQPKEVYLKYVTVQPNEFVLGNFTNDTLTDIHHYVVYRADTLEGPFSEKIAEIKFNKHKANLFFTDTTALTNEQNYYYKVQAIDSCLNESKVSNIAKTVLLTTNPEINFSSEMSWTNYEGWVSGVNYYKIYRSYTNKFEEQLIEKQLLDSGLTYIDDISDSLNDDGNYCYRVLAVSVFDTIHYEIDTSFSNFVCIRQMPHIFVPSAFTPPDGYNPIFKPILTFVPNGSYELRIYDRWGLLMASINDVKQGWDGKYKGEDAPIGIYSWQIRYKNLKNEFKYKKGTVSLIR